eukprot:SAG25_NODE_6517_length_553_cov_1.922907_1_plen_70_part_10
MYLRSTPSATRPQSDDVALQHLLAHRVARVAKGREVERAVLAWRTHHIIEALWLRFVTLVYYTSVTNRCT